MKFRNTLLKIFSLSTLMLATQSADAQCVAGDCFLKGDYVEVGTAPNGAYGTCNDAPTGYHGRIPGVGATGKAIGFVADPDKDGWTVMAPGRPDYIGDYYLPGYPQEGWSVQFTPATGGATKSDAWRGSGCTSMTGGLAGANVSCVTTGGVTTQVWEGTKGDLAIKQTTILKKDKVYFIGFIDLVNTGTSTITGLYYNRTLDPDNEAVTPAAVGGYATDNTVVYQPNSISKNCLVRAIGQTFTSYLGLGTKDCRAKAYICTGSGLTPTAMLNEIYNHNGAASGYVINVGGTALNNDVGIGVVYNLGTLAPGQKTSLAYAYILKGADLDSALGETAPKFESAGAPYSPYTTFRVCPGKTVPLKVVNGGQYSWIWTCKSTPATPHYMTATGTSTLIPAGGTVSAVTGSVTYPDGAVYGDSLEVTVWGPRIYEATGYSNCDTQRLIFYVDTISFSTPPAVTTPIRYCENETPSILTAGASAGAKLKWYNDTAAGTPSSGTAPTPSTTFPPGSTADFDTTSYWVSQENTAGCETPKAKIDVIVTRKPTPPVVTPRITYCVGADTKELTATGTLLKWYDAATAGTRYASTPTPSSAKAGLTSYFVSQTVNGCESDRAEIVVEISQSIAAFDKSTDSLCGPELLLLTNKSTTTSAGSYVSDWKFGDGASASDSNTQHSYKDARGTYTVKLHITNAFGCVDSTSQIVEVFPQPTITFTASQTKICQGDAVDFEGKVTDGYRSLTWDFGDGDPSFNVLNVRHAFTKAGTFPIQLSGTYPACEGVGSGITIEVVPTPNVNLGDDFGFCPGSGSVNLYNKNTATSVNKYIWSTGDTTASIVVRNAGQYSVRAENWKCYSSDSITVTKACYLDVPNAFAPGGGSDYNNYFLPRQLLSSDIITFSMQVYDRWGQLIFESDKINGRGWDGNYKGQPMPFGVYVYIIRASFANGISESYDGNVTLIR